LSRKALVISQQLPYLALSTRQIRLGLRDSNLGVGIVQNYQHVASLDGLRVTDLDFLYRAGNEWCDLGHVRCRVGVIRGDGFACEQKRPRTVENTDGDQTNRRD